MLTLLITVQLLYSIQTRRDFEYLISISNDLRDYIWLIPIKYHSPRGIAGHLAQMDPFAILFHGLLAVFVVNLNETLLNCH